MNKTKRILEDAMDQAMPEHGEGWNTFVNIVEAELEVMEELLKEVADTAILERQHTHLANKIKEYLS